MVTLESILKDLKISEVHEINAGKKKDHKKEDEGEASQIVPPAVSGIAKEDLLK